MQTNKQKKQKTKKQQKKTQLSLATKLWIFNSMRGKPEVKSSERNKDHSFSLKLLFCFSHKIWLFYEMIHATFICMS